MEHRAGCQPGGLQVCAPRVSVAENLYVRVYVHVHVHVYVHVYVHSQDCMPDLAGCQLWHSFTTCLWTVSKWV